MPANNILRSVGSIIQEQRCMFQQKYDTKCLLIDSLPENGTCMVSIDTFTFICDGWTDNGSISVGDNFTYNFYMTVLFWSKADMIRYHWWIQFWQVAIKQ